MTPEVDIISHLITVAPVVGVLIYFIIYFRAKEKEYKEEIKELNAELRESGKAVIIATKDLNNTLEKLIAEIKN